MSGAHEQVLQVTLWLRVENNSKFIRGKTQVRQHIEDRVLRPFPMHQPDTRGWEDTLTIPSRTEAELEECIAELLRETDTIAERHSCFIEADVRALNGLERSW